MRKLQRQDDVIALQDAGLDLVITTRALCAWLNEVRGKRLQSHDMVVVRTPNVQRLLGLCDQVDMATYKLRGKENKRRKR